MDKAKARKMYELADRLSKVDTSKLNEQQLAEHSAMVQRLGQEAQAMKQGVAEAEDEYAWTHSGAIVHHKPDRHGVRSQVDGGPGSFTTTKYHPKDLVRAIRKIQQQINQPGFENPADEADLKKYVAAFKQQAGANWENVFKQLSAELDRDNETQASQARVKAGMKQAWQQRGRMESVGEGVAEGFTGPEQEAQVRARLKELEDLDPDNMYKIVADEFNMTEDDLRAALHDESMSEAEEDLHTSFNVVKLGGALNADPRSLRAAIQRHMNGNPTRTDIMVLANAFMGMLKNSDDRQVQMIANLIKAGNPKEVPQESTAAIAERNAFVDAMRQVKKGEKFTVGGKEFTKTTSHGEDEEVKEAVDTEAYDRLKKVFDFSDFKG